MKGNILPNAFSIESIYTDGDVYLNDLLKSLGQAQKSIEFEVYIFENCKAGNRILDALKEKTSQGVEVLLMVDGFGSFNQISWLEKQCSLFQIKLKVFNPLRPWMRLLTLNRRNHRKTITIDGEVAFIGSINISHVHFASEALRPWRDLALKIIGDSAQFIQGAFYKSWNMGNDLEKINRDPKIHYLPMLIVKNVQQIRVRLNNYLLLRFYYWRDLLKRIRVAKHRVWIMNAYFVPHRTLLRSLVKAAKNGADVIIVVPGQSDVPITKWVAPVFYRYLLRNKIKVYEYSESMLHTKSLLIDGWGVIGSHNLNYRSLIHDLEIEATIDESRHIHFMEQYYLQIIGRSRLVSSKDIEKFSWWTWLRCRLILLFKYYI